MKGEAPFLISFAFALVVIVGLLTGVAAGKGGDRADRALATSPRTYWTYQGLYSAIAVGFFIYFIYSR